MPEKTTDRGVRVFLLRGLSLLFSILPPAVCTLICFPIFRARGGEAMLSGCAALMLTLCAIPLFRAAKRYLRTPSVWVMWLLAYLLFRMLTAIAAEASTIAFFGWIGNMIGALLWKLSEKKARTEAADGKREQI